MLKWSKNTVASEAGLAARYSQQCGRLPRCSIALKFQSKIPARQANNAHAIKCPVRVSAIKIDHETNRGCLFIIGIGLHILDNLRI